MGMTLANLYVLNGSEETAASYFKQSNLSAQFHQVSDNQPVNRFCSVFIQNENFLNTEQTAADLSKALEKTVCLMQLFDSDIFILSVFVNGKRKYNHKCSHTDTHVGNRAELFSRLMELSEEDAKRLDIILKKGNAEEQAAFVCLLLGVPLQPKTEGTTETQEDIKVLDQWIESFQKQKKPNKKMKTELIQEIPQFSFSYHHITSPFYGNNLEESGKSIRYGDSNQELVMLSVAADDGMLKDLGVTSKELIFHGSENRLLGLDDSKVIYDSAGFLPDHYEAFGTPYFLPDGGLFWHKQTLIINQKKAQRSDAFLRTKKDGQELFQITSDNTNVFGFSDKEIILETLTIGKKLLKRYRMDTGELIAEMDSPLGFNVWNKLYANGFWYASHDSGHSDQLPEEFKGSHDMLTKLDAEFHVVKRLALPLFTQDLYLSPDGNYLYVFIYKKQILVVDADTLEVLHVLEDPSALMPRGFDTEGHFLLQRDSSKIEAWDALLTEPVSGIRLKGSVYGSHSDADGKRYMVTWQEKEKVLRVYRIG